MAALVRQLSIRVGGRSSYNICAAAVLLAVLLFVSSINLSLCFTATTTTSIATLAQRHYNRHQSTSIRIVPHRFTRSRTSTTSSSTTALNVLLDVPDGFFTVTFFMSGILLSLAKNFARVRMEERAWEQRLEEGRRERLARDPTLTEMDLRRMEAEQEWSAYGKPRMEELMEQEERRESRRRDRPSDYRRRHKRVKVMDRDDDDDDMDDNVREYRMSDDEINAFEVQYGVDYDPYYDDPYTEDELPDGKFDVDKLYGDRIYSDTGEIFYKDESSGLFYRQGAKPRNLSFWN